MGSRVGHNGTTDLHEVSPALPGQDLPALSALPGGRWGEPASAPRRSYGRGSLHRLRAVPGRVPVILRCVRGQGASPEAA